IGVLSPPLRSALAIGRFHQPLSRRRRHIDDQVRWKIPPGHMPEKYTATRWIVRPSWNGPAFGEKDASESGSDRVSTPGNEFVEANAIDTRNGRPVNDSDTQRGLVVAVPASAAILLP